MLAEFYLAAIFQHVWKKVSIYVVHIPKKCIKSMHFYACPSSPLKIPDRVF